MRQPDNDVIYIFLIAIFFLSAVFHHNCDAAECGAGKRPLFFVTDPKVNSYMPEGFSRNFFNRLDEPLQEIGYCLTRFTNAAYNDSSMQEELVMMLSINFMVSKQTTLESSDVPVEDYSIFEESYGDTTTQIIVSLIAVNLWKTGERKRALENPIVALGYSPDELVTFESVLLKKIVENLRTQYICHLSIQSTPGGVIIRSDNGLEGKTPLEWITPLGKLPITGELEGYEPIRRKIDLNTPGNHTYFLQMKKRQFFHSGFFIPAVALGVSSAACFSLEWYYYDKYGKLDRSVRDTNPDVFRKEYSKAKAFEAAAFSALALAGTSFTLCFFF